jgi:hypothetical protein
MIVKKERRLAPALGVRKETDTASFYGRTYRKTRWSMNMCAFLGASKAPVVAFLFTNQGARVV